MYAKVKSSQLLKYPYDMSALMADNPFTNFGSDYDVAAIFPNTDQAVIYGESLVDVVVQPAPDIDIRTQRLEQTSPMLVDGIWSIGWNVVAKSDAEMAAETSAKSSSVRTDRNARLAACDWTQLADAPGDKSAWAAYRQELRDVTKQSGFPWEIVWPEKP